MNVDSFVPELCPVGMGMPEEEGVETMHPMVSGTDLFRSELEDGVVSIC